MEDAASRHYRFAAVGKSLPNQKKIISIHLELYTKRHGFARERQSPPGRRGLSKLLRYALDTPADGTELFFDAAVAAVDMPACVVHERFAFGAESCEDECRACA